MRSVLRATYGVCLASVVGCSWLHALYLGTEGRGACKAKKLGCCRLITILCISDRRCEENETWILWRLDSTTVFCAFLGPNHPHSKADMETDLRTFMSMVHYHIIRVDFNNLSVIILTSVVCPWLLYTISVLYGLLWIAHPEAYRFAPPTL